MVHIQDQDGPSWKPAEGRPDYLGDRDLVQELSAACRKRGMRFVGYILALNDQPAWKQHEDWRMQNSAHGLYPHEPDPSKPDDPYLVCCNSPYRDLVRNRLVELAQNYLDLHGVYFDMFYWPRGACYCQRCTERFKALPEVAGQEPPTEETKPLWRSWQEFQHRSIEESLRDWRQAVRKGCPDRQDFVIIANTWNGWIFRDENGASSVRVADNLDGTVEEEGWYWGAGTESFFGFPQRWPFMNLYLRSIGNNAAGPGRCVAHMWEAVRRSPGGLLRPAADQRGHRSRGRHDLLRRSSVAILPPRPPGNEAGLRLHQRP